ncbi:MULTISPECIES: TolC family protein [Chryseobacterium]|uniref:Cation efflux system protein CusC n=1 Tax=Chryseobacterium taihuense TaxID=1141221 RepID=A0A4U8WAC9_9FLAO|nr:MULTISPECIES: TolC family protein [Chryseobacterium]QQV03412.1 TolC family protein [Chryseobacterium sp. FDAARGOS 1104]VFB03271.1 Cation efflux system protein CusC precursor [Chryseobacterium taihuense]
MNKNKLYEYAGAVVFLISLTACKPLEIQQRAENKTVPEMYGVEQNDSSNTGKMKWNDYFNDQNLQALISQALQNNQELNIVLQEIEISKNEIKARKGEYLPTVGLKAGAGVDKVSRYTNIGAMEANTEIEPGKKIPEPLFDFGIGVQAKWETDIWGKLHNATRAQVQRYLATVEGKNFMITNLISEIADSYYELLALDNELVILNQNIKIQNDALNIIKELKKNARSNELAVKRFQAQVLRTQGMQYEIQQKIVETENKINFLVGRLPQPVERSHKFDSLIPQTVFAGIPSELLENRPDIKQAEYKLAASKLDVKSAKARFYPSLDIGAGIGLQAFNPVYLIKPESFLFSLAGELTAPLINRSAIKAAYKNANAKQIQAVYHYEQTVLGAYIEVANQLSKIKNLNNSVSIKMLEVDALTKSIDISNDLFKYARADYMEVLLTQRDALESRFELVEKKVDQLKASVAVYRALGGGWDQNPINQENLIKK